ncbi:MAG: DUF2188 domain-containing protein [Verrucomicrobia bacterium]|nr:DUF2188 domain-containing protein [Verrucomicrobiota bacterium]
MSQSSHGAGHAPNASAGAISGIERFFVASGHGGGWLVFREGNRSAIHRLPGKKQAVHTARILARSHSPSQVMVENSHGTFALAYAFDSSSDLPRY